MPSPVDSPYRKPEERGSSGAPGSTPNPLEGLVPRYVTAKQARDVLVSHSILCSLVER